MLLENSKRNYNHFFLINFFLFIFIYTLSILNEKIIILGISITEIKIIKYLIILTMCSHSFFVFFKNKIYLKNNQYFYFFILLFAPYVFNGLVGLLMFFKCILAIIIGFYFNFFLENLNNKNIINKFMILLISTFFTFFYFINDKFTLNNLINHKNDFGNLLLFLFFIFIITRTKKINIYIFFPLFFAILYFLYKFEMRSQFLIMTTAILLFYLNKVQILQWNKILKLLSTSSIIFILILNFSNLRYPPNPILSKFQNNILYSIIAIDDFSSQRISRFISPCKWADERYYLNRKLDTMLENSNSYKNCSIYDLNDEIPIIPIFFLNYQNIDLIIPYTEKNKNFLKEIFNIHKISESMNLDNFLNEFLRFNGVIAFVYFLIIFLILIIRLQKKCNENLLLILFPFSIYFVLQSGFGSPGNLIFIVFVIIIYRLINSEKKIFNNNLY